MSRFFSFVRKLCFHPDPVVRVKISFAYCLSGVWVNFTCLQLFCTPVWWAAVACILFLIAIVSVPFVKGRTAGMAMYFVAGVGVPICAYCAIFFIYQYPGDQVLGNILLFLFGIVLFGISILAFIPVYFLYHIYRYYRTGTAQARKMLLAGALMPMFILGIYLVLLGLYRRQLRHAANKAASISSMMRQLPADYFTERYLGMHWKYHTRMCYLYDGRRPPLHDPFWVVGLWVYPSLLQHDDLAPRSFNYSFDLDTSKKYYHLQFPDLPLDMDCRCSYGNLLK